MVNRVEDYAPSPGREHLGSFERDCLAFNISGGRHNPDVAKAIVSTVEAI